MGTVDVQCLVDVGTSEDGPGIVDPRSSAPEIVAVSYGGLAACVRIEALAEGDATVTVTTYSGEHASIVVRAMRADTVALGTDVRRPFADPVVMPTSQAYSAGTELWTGIVWQAAGRTLRGSSGEGFTLTDESVAELEVGRDPGSPAGPGGLNAIHFLAPGTTQIFWNDVPGPVLNVIP